MFFLYCEDLASALVGPFATSEEIDAHRAFMLARGDAAYPGRIVTEEEGLAMEPMMRWTPADDKRFPLPIAGRR